MTLHPLKPLKLLKLLKLLRPFKWTAAAADNPLMRLAVLALFTIAPLWLAGCDQLGIESSTVSAARREAEGKAIGAGCRHSARSVEQCYAQNKRADKAAVFTGWKEMSEYMAANKIDAVPPPPEPVATTVAEAPAEEPEADAKKSAKGAPKKH